jgi:hypothetical protein
MICKQRIKRRRHNFLSFIQYNDTMKKPTNMVSSSWSGCWGNVLFKNSTSRNGDLLFVPVIS